MRTEYENMVKEFLPALRARAAKRLAEQYHMNQSRIAGLLQTTQAAVSKYLSGRYSAAVKMMEESLDEKQVDTFVKKMVEGEKYDAQKEVCSMCAKTLTHKCNLMIK